MVLPFGSGWGGGIFACATYPINCPQDSLVLRTNCRWQFSPYSNPSPYLTNQKAAPKWCCLLFLAGVEGFEPPSNGVRVRGLTAWRHPKVFFFIIIIKLSINYKHFNRVSSLFYFFAYIFVFSIYYYIYSTKNIDKIFTLC